MADDTLLVKQNVTPNNELSKGHNKMTPIQIVIKFVLLLIGANIAAMGLELFLIPNNIIDGGVVGISIITSYVTGLPLGIFTFCLNIPFLFFGYKQIGKTFVVSSMFSITALSIGVSLMSKAPRFTGDVFLAAVFGGIFIGIGVGLILRYGGSLDGTEIVALVLDKYTAFSVGQIVMFFNIFILGSAGFFFGWDRAMYSIVAYFIAHKVIDITLVGMDEAREVLIISDEWEEISDAIIARLGRGVTTYEGKGGFTRQPKTIIYTVITRLEVAKLKQIVMDKDSGAFITVSEVSDMHGGNYRKRSIH